MYFLYILKLKNNSYYIGSCDDLVKRFQNHCQGKVKSTKAKLPAIIIYNEEFRTRPEARKKELQIKNWKSRKAIERLIEQAKFKGS